MINQFWSYPLAKRDVKNDKENSSSFPFIYVTILIDKLFRLMSQLFYLSCVIKYFKKVVKIFSLTIPNIISMQK